MAEIGDATIKVVAGPEKRSHKVSEKDKRLTAYHEAGHAVVTYFCATQDAVHEISIVPRGYAGGYTMSLPSEDRNYITRRFMEEELCTLLGGRVAEQIVFGDISTGASNDIERATEIARNMVTKWGLSDRLGPLTYSEESGEVFLGRQVTQTKQVSDVTAHAIDEEVRRVIDSNYQRAKQILTTNMDKLQAMSQALIKYETIDEEQLKDIMAGREPKPPRDWDDTPTPTPRGPSADPAGAPLTNPAGQH